MFRIIVLPLAFAAAFAAHAETPKDMIAGYTQEAARSQPGFSASAERGRTFFVRKWNVTDKMPNCAACHTERPDSEGSHVITGQADQAAGTGGEPRALQQPGQGREVVQAQLHGGRRPRRAQPRKRPISSSFSTTAGGA